MDIYQNLSFSHRAHNFKSFLPANFELPKTNPLYPSIMLPKMSREVISMVSCLLGHPNDQWVAEVILGFLISVFIWQETLNYV